MNIIDQYDYIMHKEAALKATFVKNYSARLLPLERPSQIYNTTKRIMEITKNSTVLRSGNISANLTQDVIAFESDGAHTNLVRSLVQYALDSHYGWGKSPRNYDRHEIDEAIVLHDLPENIIGDIPDNRNRDETRKAYIENQYFDKIITTYVTSQFSHCWRVRHLLQEMQNKSSLEGRILYVADKISAILMMLYYDQARLYPSIYPDDTSIAKISSEEISFCNIQADGKIRLSELWTVDFLYGRNIVQYDDTGFFLAILVMATLYVHDKWYDWREAQYLQ